MIPVNEVLAMANMAVTMGSNLYNAYQKAVSDGKDGIDEAELKQAIAADDAGKQNLADAIQEAIKQGR